MAVDECSKSPVGADNSTSCRTQQATAETAACGGPSLSGGGAERRARRKQFRPVRVCLPDDEDDADERVRLRPAEDVGGEASDSGAGGEGSVAEEHTAVGLPAQNVCELCGLEAKSSSALATHRLTCRGRSDGAADDDEVGAASRNGAAAFPTRYHELGSALMRSAETALLLNGREPADEHVPAISRDTSRAERDDAAAVANDAYDDNDAPLDFTLHSTATAVAAAPAVASAGGGGASAVKQELTPSPTGGHTIALESETDYCELCQKRFCNKYYLRKHRQDVHGVSADAAAAVQQHDVSAAQSAVHSHRAHHAVQQQHADSSLPQSAPLSLATGGAHLDVSASSSASSTSSQLPPLTPFQISSLPPFVLPFQTSSTSTSNAIGSLFQSPATAVAVAGGAGLGSAGTPGLLPGLTSLMLLNPFASSLALLNSPSFLQQQTAPLPTLSASSSLNTLAELQKTSGGAEFGGLCDDAAALGALINPFLPPPPPLPPSETADELQASSHQCELCHKEFYNAYFLAVHRRDKHGVAMSTTLSDAMRLLAAGSTVGARPGSVETAASAAAEPGEKLPSGGGRPAKSSSREPVTSASRAASSERSSASSEQSQSCYLCSQPFPNRYGLALHLLRVHGILPEGFGLAGELLQQDGVAGRPLPPLPSVAGPSSSGTGGKSSAHSASTSTSSSKQSDRVSCDICNKEVCNKYFLKTHKMKVHGLDSAAAAIYNPPPPPPAQTAAESSTSAAVGSRHHRHHHHHQHHSQPSPHQQPQLPQHDEMRKALLMADSQFNAFASQLDLALKSAAGADPSSASGAAFGGFLPSLLQQQGSSSDQQQMMSASDIFRLFGLMTGKQAADDPMLSLGVGPPPPGLGLPPSLFAPSDLCELASGEVAGQTGKPLELKIPKHASSHQKDSATGHNHHHHHQQQQQGGSTQRVKQHQTPGRQRDPRSAAPPPPLSEHDLIQPGIDPEAYCELCQKEFCSKYFLRTHRQKIHGLSTGGKPDSAASSFDHYRPASHSQTTSASSVLQLFPGVALPAPPPGVFGSSSAALLASAAMAAAESGGGDAAMQGRAAAGKETAAAAVAAANATRVTCDVCGKELCNKYFLKTHMAKIHGIGTSGVSHSELDLAGSYDVAAMTTEKPDHSVPHQQQLVHSSAGEDRTHAQQIAPLALSLPTTESAPLTADISHQLSSSSTGNVSGVSMTAPASDSTNVSPDLKLTASRTDLPELSSSIHSAETLLSAGPTVDSSINSNANTGDNEKHLAQDCPTANSDVAGPSDSKDATMLQTSNSNGDASIIPFENLTPEGEKRKSTREFDDGVEVKRLKTTEAVERSNEQAVNNQMKHTGDRPASCSESGLVLSDTSSGSLPVAASAPGIRYPWPLQGEVKPDDVRQPQTDDAAAPRGSADGSACGPSSAPGQLFQTPLNSLSTSVALGADRAPWFASVNGHVEPPPPRCAVSDEPHPAATVSMQPFVMHQQPPQHGASSASSSGPSEQSTQFAPCQLVLPVVRPVRDQITVEFSVTPVSSSSAN